MPEFITQRATHSEYTKQKVL